MNSTNRTTLPPDDELDGLLRAFFRAERPDPWPAMKAPPSLPFPTPAVNGRGAARQSLSASPRPAGTAARRPLWRSRMALAASVALLLGGTLFLPRAPLPWRTPAGPETPGASTASTDERERIRRDDGSEKPAPMPPMGPMTPPADR